MPDRFLRADGGAKDYREKVPVRSVYDVFEQREDAAKPLTANDIMDELGCSRRTAHNKLNELVERGVLETRKVGSRSRVWWVPMDDEETGGIPDHPLADEVISDIDLPGTGETLKARRRALIAAYRYLQEYPEAKKSDFLQNVYPEHTAEFETAEGWWNAIQPALAELPGVDPPKERGHFWHFLGG